MDYIAPRNMTAVSLSGRSVEFKKGVPTYAPPQMHAELIAVGIVPAEEIPEVVSDEPQEPTVPAEREAALFAAFEKLVLRANREDFTAVGVPQNAILAKTLGWSNIGAKERDASWLKFNQGRAA